MRIGMSGPIDNRPSEEWNRSLVRHRATCGLAACFTFILTACVSSGAIDAEIRDGDPPRKVPSLRRPGGLTVFLAWPRQDFRAYCSRTTGADVGRVCEQARVSH